MARLRLQRARDILLLKDRATPRQLMQVRLLWPHEYVVGIA